MGQVEQGVLRELERLPQGGPLDSHVAHGFHDRRAVVHQVSHLLGEAGRALLVDLRCCLLSRGAEPRELAGALRRAHLSSVQRARARRRQSCSQSFRLGDRGAERLEGGAETGRVHPRLQG